MIFHRASRYTLALGLIALPAVAGAQAFGLNEIGTCAIARGFAVTGAPCADASNIFWNPGAMPGRPGITASAGVALISLKGDFTRDTSGRVFKSDIPTAAVPSIFLNYGSGRMALGIGVYVPYGLTSQWGDDFPGRFSAKKASLQTIYVQPNIAFQLTDNWSIGGGPVIGQSTVELVQALDLSSQFAQPNVTFGNLGIPKYTEFARASLKGSASAYGVHVGLHGKITPTVEFGARLLTPLTFNYDDADATFTPTNTGLVLAAGNAILPGGVSGPLDLVVASQFTGSGALTSQKVSTSITHPAQVQMGLGYTGFANTTLSADFAWTGWKAFKQLPVTFKGPAAASSRVLQEDYNNTSSIRLGAERKLESGIKLRAGFAAAASAAPQETVTPLLPEQDRELGMIGIAIPFGGFALDATYARIFTPGSRGRIDERATGGTQAQALALNSGVYTLNANILAFGIKYGF